MRKILFVMFIALVIPFFASASDTTWEQLKIQTQMQYQEGLGAGRQMQWMTSGARCESNPDIIYLAHDCGGIWKSTDGGVTWTKPRAQGLYLQNSMSIAVDPVDCNRVVGVWTNAWDIYRANYAGIYLTTDGGETWSFEGYTSSTYTPQGGYRFYQDTVTWARSSVDAQGATTWFSVGQSDSSRSDYATSGLYRSTDRGVTWSKRYTFPTSILPIYDIEVSPTTATTVLMATAGGLKKSTDGGATFAALGNLPSGRVTSLEFHPSDANTIYAVVQNSTANGLYRSTDGGTSFTRMSHGNSTINSTLQAARTVHIHPSNGNIFYALPDGGSYKAIRTTDAGVNYSTTNVSFLADVGAYTWGEQLSNVINDPFSFILMSKTDYTKVSAQNGGARMVYSTDGINFVDSRHEHTTAPPMNRGLVWSQSNPDVMLAGCMDGGPWWSENGGLSWTKRSAPAAMGCTGGSQYENAIHPTQPNIMLSTCQINWGFSRTLLRTTDSGQNWTTVDSTVAQRHQVWFRPDNGNYAYAGTRRSTNAGATWTSMTGIGNGQVMDYCRSNPLKMYAVDVTTSPQKILRSTDGGDSWNTYVAPGWAFGVYDDRPVFALDQNNCDTIWTVDANRDLASYNGSSWSSKNLLPTVSRPADYWISIRGVLVDPNNHNVIYATLSGFGVSPLIWRSTDGGATWGDITYNHVLYSQGGLSIDPGTGRVYAQGNCTGFWFLDAPYAESDTPPPQRYDSRVPIPPTNLQIY